MLTDKEINAIRFYQGDIRRKGKDGKLLDWANATGFWGIPRAYKTMNCLMFEGVDNEKERTAEDTDSLNPQIFLEIEKVTEVFCDIFRAMCKCAESREDSKEYIKVYRTDRGSSISEMKAQGRTVSFTSTSKENHPVEYFQKKKKLTLLEILLPSDIPYLDLEEILGGDYYYADQREILLPPFLYASFHEGKLTEAEERYRDTDGQPPYGKYIIFLDGISLHTKETKQGQRGWQIEDLTKEKEKAAAILKKIKINEEISGQELNQYCDFKKMFREIIIEKFRQIQRECAAKVVYVEDKRHILIADVKKRIVDYDGQRKHYKRCMRACNIVLAILSVIPVLCISLSFIDELDIVMKIMAIVMSAGAMIITRILKVEVYPLKLLQRTKTCLALRDLSRQMKYEQRWDEQKIGEYVQLFRTIMKEDTDMSWKNLQVQIENESDLFQDDIIT